MNYIVLIDEAGQPYIAHGLWSSAKSVAKKAGSAVKSTATSAGRSAHKYLMKVGEGAKARYFYTKAEIDAFRNGKQSNTNDTNDTNVTRTLSSNSTVANRPTGRKVSFSTSSGSTKRRGEGLNTGPVGTTNGRNPTDSEKEKEKEYRKAKELVEAVEAINELNRDRRFTHSSASHFLEALGPAMLTYPLEVACLATYLFIPDHYTKEYYNEDRGTLSEMRRNAKIVGSVMLKDIKKEVSDSFKTISEINDYAKIVIKDYAKEKLSDIEKIFKKSK